MQAYAVVTRRPGEAKLERITVPDPTDDDVVVRTTYSMISPGTEGSFIRGERTAGDTPWREGDPHPFPHVPGYQKVGVAEWVGKNVAGVQPGDTLFCTVSKVEGMHFPFGGHVSPAVTVGSEVWRLPDGVDPVSVSGLVLTQVGYNCGIRPTIQPGDKAIVIGDGLVGHWSAQTLAYRGAQVMLVGRYPAKLERYSLRQGDLTVALVDNDVTALVDEARKWAPHGVQALIDTVGSVATIEALYPVMNRGSHVISAGFHGTRGLIDIQPMRNRELTLHAPAGWTRERMDATLQHVIAGSLDVKSLITHTFPVQEAHKAYELILGKHEPSLGVVLDWNRLRM